MTISGEALSVAWTEWVASPEGAKCMDGDPLHLPKTDHVYLHNRLWKAFMDGAAMAEQIRTRAGAKEGKT